MRVLYPVLMVSQHQNGVLKAQRAGADPLKYTETAGGTWMWAERAAVGTAVVATSLAVCAPVAQQAFRRGGWLNSNPYLRVGFGQHQGRRVFRAAGRIIDWIGQRSNAKIDFWRGGPI